jgi:hypothetical protein
VSALYESVGPCSISGFEASDPTETIDESTIRVIACALVFDVIEPAEIVLQIVAASSAAVSAMSGSRC